MAPWQEMPFSEAVEINPKVMITRGKVYPFVDMKSVVPSSHTVREVEMKEYTGGGSKFLPYDTLMARITPCLENGKIARYVPEYLIESPAFGSTEFIVVRGRDGITDNNYAYYLTQWMEFRNFAISQMTGSSGRQRVPVDSLSGFLVSLPPLPTQERIADILGSLDDKIELNRRMNATLEATARAIFKSWFVDFDPVYAKMEGRDYPLPAEVLDLFPDELVESELGLIPKGWRVGTLGDVITIHDSKRIPLSRKQREERPGNYPYYGATKVMDYVNDYLFDGNYVLMGEDGSVITEEGYPFLQYVWGKFWANNHAHVLEGKNGFSTEHLYILLKKTNIKPFVTGAVQAKLNQGNMNSIPIILPRKGVLERFDLLLQSFFAKLRNNEAQILTIEKTRDTLLPKLLSGEIEV